MRLLYLDKAFDTFLFYCGWVLCLSGVASGHVSYGLLSIFLIVAYRFYRSLHRKADGILFLLVLLIGPLSDSLYAYFGVLEYKNLSPLVVSGVPPLWTFFMWALLAVNIPLFGWLRKKRYLASLLGAFGGPLSYLSAIRLEGAILLKPFPIAMIVIGGMWAVFLPFLLWLEGFLRRKCKS